MSTPQRVYFFGTCLIDLLYPKAGLAGMALIKRQGMKVVYPANQGCCGQPAFNSGYRQEALAVARAQLNCFAKDYPIVVPSGSCAGMVKHHWPELFAGEPDESQAIDVAERTYELTEFLVDVLALQLKDLGQPTKIAIHTSCSARREMGVADRIDTLIAQLSNVEVMDQSHKTECCGFGGTFSVKQPDISGAMVEAKCNALLASGADSVISQDCGCLMNIGGALEHQQHDLPTQHVAEFLLQRTSGEDE
ncbi:MAG: (Fe-S)-binding protein [Candidatus Thiodiazotropha sp. (ex. Lucinisca nassula)]|nr:(Fe-S)-binding protein [Candidatus Thiodiazotropha sp. (ex. Lucinisca nassula)]MBW9263639.1 (Fe-S)-binding protein [Candidatus Thiodiazotropha sp. (ex. Lucinisca nassula)]MBW9269191.1 (Fe-S)-binding protein [Candidatus Thiodiazotropha sp. (ex. Lucinisca nassula)]